MNQKVTILGNNILHHVKYTNILLIVTGPMKTSLFTLLLLFPFANFIPLFFPQKGINYSYGS